MQLRQAYELFIADRKIGGVSPKTISFYGTSAGSFLRFAGGNTPTGEVALHITPYFLALQERDLTDTTRHTYWRGIRAFVRFLHAEGYVDHPIKLPKLSLPQTTIRSHQTGPIAAISVSLRFRIALVMPIFGQHRIMGMHAGLKSIQWISCRIELPINNTPVFVFWSSRQMGYCSL
jgi:hypothetical protein